MSSAAYMYPLLSINGRRIFKGTTSLANENLLDLRTWIDYVCEELDIPYETFINKARHRPAVEARQIACYLYNRYCVENRAERLTLFEMGTLIGGRDHATVLYGIKNIKALMEVDKTKREVIENLYKKALN
jgi:chromosomal replication initiator protein